MHPQNLHKTAKVKRIKVIGFDADDTLWENGRYFKEVEDRCCELMTDYLAPDAMRRLLYNTEQKNMSWYGYGVMAYTLSLVEAAIEASDETLPASLVKQILSLGSNMLKRPVSLLPGVERVLPLLHANYKLIVVTKGDLLDQERKLQASGLLPFFHHIEVLSEKHLDNYRRLLTVLGIQPDEFLMVGNSLRSDVLPVLTLGGMAVHIPQPEVWVHENAEIPAHSYVTMQTMDDLPRYLLSF